MATSFWVIMQKRKDGKVYADLHKSTEHLFLTVEEAGNALEHHMELDSEVFTNFHIVEMVAETKEDWTSNNA